MNQSIVLSLDLGTTGSTAVLVDFKSSPKIIGKHNAEYPQHFPKEGWVEHDVDEIWQSMSTAIKNVLKTSSISTKKIKSIGITNQRETVVAVDKKTLKPYGKAIVWQCRRTTGFCNAIKKDPELTNYIHKNTGLVVDPYFSGSKIKWLIEHHNLQSKVKAGDVMFLTMDAYLLAKLTRGKSIFTEASNASRTMLMNIKTGAYDSKLLELFGISNQDCLPPIKDSSGHFGSTEDLGFLPSGIPITGMLGDQQAALAGQGCYKENQAKCTYGTGAFILVNCGQSFKTPPKGLLNTIAWKIDGKLTYAVEGSCFVAGSAVQYVRDQLSWINSSGESEQKASNDFAAPQVIFIPALAGLGSPYWNPQARGAFLGLSRGTDQPVLMRAVLEGIAFQVNDLLSSINESGITAQELAVDGGAAANNILMQVQADFSGIKIRRPKALESTALGAAIFAALGSGLIQDLSEVSKKLDLDQEFLPNKEASYAVSRQKQLDAWKLGVQAVSIFSQRENG